MSKLFLFTLCLSLGLLVSSCFSPLAQAAVYPTSRTCTPGESWFIDAPVPEEYRSEFKDFIRDKSQERAIRGFSEAIAMKKSAKTEVEKWFSEYWISRALYKMNLPHVAYIGFLSITKKTPDAELMPLHAAAMDCLLRLHQEHPSIAFVLPSVESLKVALDTGLEDKYHGLTQTIAWDSITAGVQTLIADDRVTPREIQGLLQLLDGAGAYEALAQGIWSAKQNLHAKTIEYLSEFFKQKVPDSLVRYEDTAHLLLARAEYSVGQYDVANLEMKAVSRKSNELADSLSELAWSDLMAEKYPEAIGTAMNLEAGGLRHTYAPEAPMVAAMAMNELCQYPDAVNEIQIFKNDYGKSYLKTSTNRLYNSYKGKTISQNASRVNGSDLLSSSRLKTRLIFSSMKRTPFQKPLRSRAGFNATKHLRF
jgi:hypothetical protein